MWWISVIKWLFLYTLKMYREYWIPMKLVMCQYGHILATFTCESGWIKWKTNSSPKIYRREKTENKKKSTHFIERWYEEKYPVKMAPEKVWYPEHEAKKEHLLSKIQQKYGLRTCFWSLRYILMQTPGHLWLMSISQGAQAKPFNGAMMPMAFCARLEKSDYRTVEVV